MIRPESVAVGRAAPSGPAAVAIVIGRATNVAFMGNHTRITVQTDAGVLVALRFHESDERVTSRRGWSIERCTYGGIRANRRSSPPATNLNLARQTGGGSAE